MFLVQEGGIYFVNDVQELIYRWKLADDNVNLLRTWISICFFLDYPQNSMEMFRNGERLEPDFNVRAYLFIH